MSVLQIPNVKIVGIASCVPKNIDENINYPGVSEKEIKNLIEGIGVERKRIADKQTCTSDLCFKAAEKLIDNLGWDKKEIDCLIFVSQTPDYILPATSCILQNKLGLSNECYAADISLGCSGYVYGLSMISSLISHGSIKKGLLLVGDTTSKTTSPFDKTSWPLFGDAGTATAIEYQNGEKGIMFHNASDGSGANAIIIPDGGYRNFINKNTLKFQEIEEGVKRNNTHCILEGMDVFSFAITKAPKSIKKILELSEQTVDSIDLLILHQANLMLNETIVKKLKIEKSKVPYSLKNYGNTSSASIPLTLTTEKRNDLENSKLKIVICGFGVGLSWATAYFETNKIICPELIEY